MEYWSVALTHPNFKHYSSNPNLFKNKNHPGNYPPYPDTEPLS